MRTILPLEKSDSLFGSNKMKQLMTITLLTPVIWSTDCTGDGTGDERVLRQ